MEMMQFLPQDLHSGTARRADCGFRSATSQGGAPRGLCLRSTSTSTLWNRGGSLGRDSEEELLAVAMARRSKMRP